MSALLWPDWSAPPNVRACTTLRHAPAGVSPPPFDHFNLGMSSGDVPGNVEHNRAALRGLAGLPAEPRWLRQVHGTRVLRFAAADGPAPQAPEADAAVSSDAGVVLAILTADCLPVLFCSRRGDELGAAHAGWRGLAAGVLETTVAAMRTPAAELVAWLGPAAGPASYEVGEEVRAAFPGCDEAFAPTRPGHWKADLYAIARRKLTTVGVTRTHGGGFDTIAEPARFFSHRRDGRAGRFVTLIWR
jgi:YfiH family protein